MKKHRTGVSTPSIGAETLVSSDNTNGTEVHAPEWKKVKLGDVVEINPKNKNLPDSFIYIDLESVKNGILLKKQLYGKTKHQVERKDY